MAHLEEILFMCLFRGVWSAGQHSFLDGSLQLELCGKLLGGIPKEIYIFEKNFSPEILSYHLTQT